METASTTSAVAAEKQCFIQVLEEARQDFNLKLITTDGHLGIAKHMREKVNDVVHNQVT
jgi:hypothetical protein